MLSNQDNIPYFGDILEISMFCTCGFKLVDTIILSQKEPLRHQKRVRCEGDLWSRVVRSTSGTIRIPEWGIDIEPGPASEGYITNVEGVIERVQNVVGMAMRWSETDEEREKAEKLLDTMREARDGKPDFTIIIEDPQGNSAVIGDGVEVTRLTEEEAQSLPSSMFIIDK
jgi:zinc finger protein